MFGKRVQLDYGPTLSLYWIKGELFVSFSREIIDKHDAIVKSRYSVYCKVLRELLI